VKSSAERNLCGAFLFYLYNEKRKDKKHRRKSILMKLWCYNGLEGKGKEDVR
jgi:hypothetical protein